MLIYSPSDQSGRVVARFFFSRFDIQLGSYMKEGPPRQQEADLKQRRASAGAAKAGLGFH